eukprot:5061962-Amphidinium_carterae.1
MEWSSKFRACVGAMHGGQVGKMARSSQQNRSNGGEGLEAWRKLFEAYEPRSMQTIVARLLALLQADKVDALLEGLDRLKKDIGVYEPEARKLDDFKKNK